MIHVKSILYHISTFGADELLGTTKTRITVYETVL